jgi:Flp pilus assembly secretin CpaC
MKTMVRLTDSIPLCARSAVMAVAALMVLIPGGAARAAETPLAGAISADLAGVVAQGMTVTMDQARVLRLPANVSTLVIGNPLIADASVQRGGLMVLTGKSVGATNLIALDGRGEPLLTIQIRVRVQNDSVVQVYRGVDRETYSCSPTCERTIAVGDSKAFFETALGNARTRDGAASAGGAAPR